MLNSVDSQMTAVILLAAIVCRINTIAHKKIIINFYVNSKIVIVNMRMNWICL